MKICKICGKEFENRNAKTCSKECSNLNIERIKLKHYNEKVKPKLPGKRPLLTEEEKKQIERDYNNSPERKIKLKEYRQVEEHKVKERESGKRYHEKNPNVSKNRHLKRKFGITIEEYNSMLKSQNGVCAICKINETSIRVKNNRHIDLSIDHCHKTGKVRGLLCFKCNSSLGKFKDSIETLQNAIDYLKKSLDNNE
jgi:hypothetical protein